MKIHLGCGIKHIQGWIHVDIAPYKHVDHVCSVDNLSFLANNSVELIYGSHILEHFGRNEYRAALLEWFRVLRKPGGILRLSVPNFTACADLYVRGELSGGLGDILGLLVGGQRDEFDFHKMVFDEVSLTRILLETGFSRTRLWDWKDTEHAHIDDYSQAYLPHMDKQSGCSVSLNIEAIT